MAINRYTLKLLGLPIPLFAFQPREANENYASATEEINLIGVKIPDIVDGPKGAYAVNFPKTIPTFGKSDKDLEESDSYYGEAEDGEYYNQLNGFANTLKVNEGNIPYLHGELIKFGKVPFGRLDVSSEKSYIDDEKCITKATFEDAMDLSKMPYNDQAAFISKYNASFRNGNNQAFIYEILEGTPKKLYEWFETDNRGLMYQKRIYTTTPNANTSVYIFEPETGFNSVAKSATTSGTDSITYDTFQYHKSEKAQHEKIFLENETGNPVYVYSSFKLPTSSRYEVYNIYFAEEIKGSNIIEANSKNYINLQCYKETQNREGLDTSILEKSFLNMNDNEILDYDHDPDHSVVEWFTDSAGTLWFLSMVEYQEITNVTFNFDDVTTSDPYYEFTGETSISKTKWEKRQGTDTPYSKGMTINVYHNNMYFSLTNENGDFICPGVDLTGAIEEVPIIIDPSTENQGG